MKGLLLAVMICTFSVAAVGASKPKFSEVPDGRLSESVYTNEGLGIKFQVPDGWTPNTDGEIPAGLDFHPAKSPTKQCVKVLLKFSVPNPVHSDYKSTGSLFVLDPGCFRDAKFPGAVDRQQFRDFSAKMIGAFSKSPYIGPDGADIGYLQQEGLIFVLLTGDDVAHLQDGSSVHENILFAITEFNGYWIAWGARADDERTQQLKKAQSLKFWRGPKGMLP